MERFSDCVMLYQGRGFKVYQAWSAKREKEVVVKEYQRNGIHTAEGLLKEAILQARQKPCESAVLVDVAFSSLTEDDYDDIFCVNFILEKKQSCVAAEVIQRDDSMQYWAPGLSQYYLGQNLYTVSEAGATKRVDLAFSDALQREVVIKSIECNKVTKANDLVREGFLLAYVEHEYNCRLFDICITRDTSYSFRINLVMEKCVCDVKRVIFERERPKQYYTEAELLQFLQNVACGLMHAKSLVSATQYIAHRDIKPGNIFLGEDGRYKVGDYGSAWKKTRRTRTASAIGTEMYISPETLQCMADLEGNYAVDPFLADVYSLGVTVMHMAALRTPLVTEILKVVNAGDISDEFLHYLAAVDPVLKAYRGCEDLRQKFLELLVADSSMLGVRINIIRSSQETLNSLSYSEGFKQLLGEMVAVDPMRRIRLENVIGKVDDLIYWPAAHRVGEQQRGLEPAQCSLCGREALCFLRLDKPTELCAHHAQKVMEFYPSIRFPLQDADVEYFCECIWKLLQHINCYDLTSEELALLYNLPKSPSALFNLSFTLIGKLKEERGSLESAPDEFHCPMCLEKLQRATAVLTVLPCTSAFHAVCNSCAREKNRTVCPMDGVDFDVTPSHLQTVSLARSAPASITPEGCTLSSEVALIIPIVILPALSPDAAEPAQGTHSESAQAEPAEPAKGTHAESAQEKHAEPAKGTHAEQLDMLGSLHLPPEHDPPIPQLVTDGLQISLSTLSISSINDDELEERPPPPVFHPIVPTPNVERTSLPLSDLQPPNYALNRFATVLPPINLPREERIGDLRSWSLTSAYNQVEAVIFVCSFDVQLLGVSIAAPVEKGQTTTVKYINIYLGVDASQKHAYSHANEERIDGGDILFADIYFAKPFKVVAGLEYSLKVKLVGEPDADYEAYRGSPFDLPDYG